MFLLCMLQTQKVLHFTFYRKTNTWQYLVFYIKITESKNIWGGRKMSENTEKKKALEMAMSQIEKQFGKGSVMKLRRF